MPFAASMSRPHHHYHHDGIGAATAVITLVEPAATNMDFPVCDDFDDYPGGTNLSDANPTMYSIAFPELDEVDFLVRDDGTLGRNPAAISSHSALFNTTWENGTDLFYVSIHMEVQAGALEADAYFFGLEMGRFSQENDETSFLANVECGIPGGCTLYDYWADASGDAQAVSDFYPIAEGYSETHYHMVLSATQDGVLTAVVNNVSTVVASGVARTLPLTDFEIDFSAGFLETNTSYLDDLSYTGCEIDEDPTPSGAPSPSGDGQDDDDTGGLLSRLLPCF